MRRIANAMLNEEFRKIFVRRTKINHHFSFPGFPENAMRFWGGNSFIISHLKIKTHYLC